VALNRNAAATVQAPAVHPYNGTEVQMLQRVEWYFPAANGEGDIFARGWLAENPRAVIQIAHGMAEHSGRYDDFAAALCSRGYSVVANDHTGHGLSAHGTLGTFAQKPGGFDFAVQDMARLFEYAETQLGVLPRIMMGHSMGSMLAALYADRYSDYIALIMTGCPAPIALSGFAIKLANRIVKRHGYLARSPLLEKLSGSVRGLTGEKLEQKELWLTRDIDIVRAFISDPLCGFDLTASGFGEMLSGFRTVASADWGKNIPGIPVLIAAGANDSVGKKGKGPVKYAGSLRKTGHTDVTLKIFPDDHHEILNEFDRDDVYTYILDWLDSRTVGQ